MEKKESENDSFQDEDFNETKRNETIDNYYSEDTEFKGEYNNIKTFIGTYKNGKYDEGKEVYYDKNKDYYVPIFKGKYKNGEKWDGCFINPYNSLESGKLIEGCGIDIEEYNFKGELVFKGEYKDGKYYNGKAKIYNRKDLIFEGEIKEGKKYNGKEYNYNKQLIFEGEYKDGKKYKGKEYDNYGHLIFEGEYKDGQFYNGKIKLYSFYNILFFEGEYKNGNKWNGIFYDKNQKESGKLVDGNGINIKEYHIEKFNYQYELPLEFEGEYKDGKRYKGKEYDNLGQLIFEGIYNYKDNIDEKEEIKNNKG